MPQRGTFLHQRRPAFHRGESRSSTAKASHGSLSRGLPGVRACAILGTEEVPLPRAILARCLLVASASAAGTGDDQPWWNQPQGNAAGTSASTLAALRTLPVER